MSGWDKEARVMRWWCVMSVCVCMINWNLNFYHLCRDYFVRRRNEMNIEHTDEAKIHISYHIKGIMILYIYNLHPFDAVFEWEYSAVIVEYGRFPEHTHTKQFTRFIWSVASFVINVFCLFFPFTFVNFACSLPLYRSFSLIEQSKCDILT